MRRRASSAHHESGMRGFPPGEGPVNTRSMDMRPDYREDMVIAEDTGDGVSLVLCLSGDVFKAAVNYPIVVEGWERRKSGRVKREWMKQFTESERSLISRYYAKFYKWYLVTGTPDKVMFRKTSTLNLLKRAVEFFASV
jgi:hypothetical protein